MGNTAASTYMLFKKKITCIKFMYDTDTVAVGDEDGSVSLCTFNESNGKLTIENTRSFLSGEVKDVAFMHTKKVKVIACGVSAQQKAKCLNNMGIDHGSINGPQSSVACCAVNKTSSFSETVRLFLGCDNGHLYLNVSDKGSQFTGTGTLIDNIPGGFFTGLVYDDATDKVVATASDKTVRIFDGLTGEKLATIEGEHTKTVYDVKAFAEGGEARFVTSSGDNTIKAWKFDEAATSLTLVKTLTPTGEESNTRAIQGLSVTTVGDSQYIFAVNTEGTVIHIKDGEVVGTDISYKDQITGLAYAGGHLYVSSENQVFRTGADGEITRVDGIGKDSTILRLFSDKQDTVYASTIDNKLLKITGTAVDREAVFEKPIQGVAFAGTDLYALRLNSGGGEHFIDEVDVAELAVKKSNALGYSNALSLSFATGKGELWVSDTKGKSRVYSPADFSEVATVEAADNKKLHCTLTFADGSKVATFDDQGQVKIWDADSKEKVRAVWNQREAVKDADITADGCHVFTISNDMTMFHYNITEEKEVKHFIKGPHEDRASKFLEIDPAGELVYTAGNDCLVKFWDPSSEQWTLKK